MLMLLAFLKITLTACLIENEANSIDNTEKYYDIHLLQNQEIPHGKSSLADNSNHNRDDYYMGPQSGLFMPEFTTTSKHNQQATCGVTEHTANCSFRNLTKVPNSTQFPASLIRFDLHNNSITALMEFAFSTLVNLEWLDLSRNIIVSLSEGSFSGLGRLKTLNLSFNGLTMMDLTFPDGVFRPLKALKLLRLNKNNPGIKNGTGLNYPDRALSALVNLTYLALDGIPNNTFGPGFQAMTSLRNLSLTDHIEGDCHMWSLYNTTFMHLSNLEYLHLVDCFIKGLLIEPGAFSPLRKLYFLDLTHNEDIDVPYLANVFYGLKDITTLKILKMELVVNRYSLGICLESRYINHFPPYLEEFHASENNLEAVDRQVIRNLSPSLKKLNVTGNKFVFGTYLQDLPLMANLTEIDLSGGSFTYNLPSQYPFELLKYDASNNCSLYQRTLGDAHKNPFVINLPPNLKSIKMNKAGLRYTLSSLRVGENSLERLSLTGNYFPVLQGPFYGFDKLQYLDLSSSFVERIEPDFFATLTSLKFLNLSLNLLGNKLAEDASSTNVFSPLTNLQLLNLSFNALTKLPPNIFRNLTNLRILLLEKNSLIDFNIDLSSLKKLNYLDLKETRIASLSTETQRQIDDLIQINITVNMQWNPILCECSNQQFLVWMTSSEAFDKTFNDYSCVYEDSSYKQINDSYVNVLMQLDRACTTHVTLFLMVGGTTVGVFCFIAFAVLYRFRWKIRYMYYAAYLQYKKSSRGGESKDYRYDAFVSYDHDDSKFVLRKLEPELAIRGLKLCLHGRDFLTGDYIASNIVKAVRHSRKTVVVLTRNMVKSYWCGYEIQMANMENIHTGRQVLVFLLMEKVPTSDLGVELLYNIRNNTYITFPENDLDNGSLNIFWDKLANDIRE